MIKYSALALLGLLFSILGNAQMGRLGDVTISSKTIVNEFTSLTSDASVGDLIINVAQSSLNANNRFPTNLEQGDLILIHQAQGASVNASPEPWTGNGIYGLPQSPQWGEVTNYNNCGNYEYAEVKSVISPTQIELLCGLAHDYTASGKVQIVRVPRYNNLTLTDTLTTEPWNGNTGGILAVEVGPNPNTGFNGWGWGYNSTFNFNGVMDVSGLGFRGGVANEVNSINGGADYASINPNNGGMKGESIAGYDNDYIPFGGQYGKGAPANGGGGSCAHNGGGGGGANGGDVSLWTTGTGVPSSTYSSAWNLETPIPTINSGGGRGGYTFSSNNQDALTTPPGDASWGSDSRRNQGGLGGRPLDYSTGKVFFGGGGGSGDRNDSYNQGGSGGKAGGIVFLRVYGTTNSQSSIIQANGVRGENLVSVNTPFWGYGGNDGAGGGGAGGTIVIESRSLTGSLHASARGGNGGNQILERGLGYLTLIDEAEGPGGGGGGGMVLYSSILSPFQILTHVQGGTNGITNSDALLEFQPNGATSGSSGSSSLITSGFGHIDFYNYQGVVCWDDSVSMEAHIDHMGNLNTPWYWDFASDSTIVWYDTDFNIIQTGSTFTSGDITSDTSFYIGTCPYTTPMVKIHVQIGSSFTLDTTGLTVINEHCGQSDGSITGIVATGGYQPLTYEWNGTLSNQADTTQLSSGKYSLKISDNLGCAVVLDSITIENESGPQLDTLSAVIADESCNQLNGSVQGVTLQGGSAPYVYTWDGTVSSSMDTANLPSGVHELIVEDAFGCRDTATFLIGEIQPPILDTSIVLVLPENCGQQNGVIQNIIIQGGTSPFTYNWNGTASSLDLSGVSSGNYQLIVVDDLGCSDTVNFNIGETLPPIIDTANIVLVPESCGAQNGSISGIGVTGGVQPYNYWWNGSQSSSMDIGNLQGGNYELVVIDNVGCRDSISVDIASLGSPTASFVIPDTVYSNEEFVIQNTSSSDVVSWLYHLGNGTQSQLENPTVMYEENGVYLICLTVENNNGCQDSICDAITVIKHELPLIVPNVFTPNNDGENDVFVIFGLKDTYGLQIFNRWGKLIFEETPYLNDWKGKSSSGAELSEGTYYYIITDKDKEITKGYFSLFK